MADEENPGDGVEELCEFWEWALAKKRELEERVAELSDPAQPRRDSVEKDIVAMAKSDGELAEAIEEKRKQVRKFWRAQNERDLRTAEGDLQRFLHGPVARSHSGRPVFERGLSGMVSSAPRFTFRQAWEGRMERVLVASVVDALCGYFGASENTRPASATWQQILPVAALSEREKKWYEARTRLMVLILEEQRKPWNVEILRAAGQEAEALMTRIERSRPVVGEGAPRWNEAKLKAFDLVAERTGRTRASVIKIYQDFRD